ncbi:MAG: carbohydrate-binding domain-containing protein [Bacteroidales bacterium]|nr:carbohydrate-binding domain-containing protein [Bacteroidales bacterium]
MRKVTLILLPLAILMFGSCIHDDILITDEAFDSGDTSLSDPELSWSASSCEATIGSDSNDFPTLVNSKGVSVTYTSSDTAVATIDEDGSITLVSAGTTSIMASSAATDKYSASSASYALTVYKGDGISWSATNCTVTYGEESTYSFPSLNNPGAQDIKYSSSNESVATISNDGTVTIVGEGDATITATATENDAYESASVSYTLTVEGTLEKAGISWSADSYTATLASENNEFPTLANPNGLTVNYSSSNTDVATVNDSGEVTPVAAGTVSIIATTEADEQYAAGSASYTLKVVKHDVTISWSAASCSQILEEEDTGTYPTLTVEPSAISGSVSYESSSTSVATISQSGSITLAGTGSTTISAVFEGNDYYKAASATYTLNVKSNADTGAGTYTYDSSGDTSSDDDISNTTFGRMITVTYSSSGATVTGYTSDFDVTVSSNQVTITNNGTENVVYYLTGSASNGFFKLYSSKKQALHLNNLSLTNTSGAAINNQSGKRTFVYVEGSNTLADGSSAAYSTSSSEDMKAVFFSEGQLIFSGSGSLKVTANNSQEKSCIASDDYVRIMDSPSITVSTGSSAGHGIRGKEYVQLSSGTTSITSAAAKKKGITSEDYVLVEGGSHTIKVTGKVAYDSEDSEYKGTAGIKADNYFGMTGGTVTITNSGAGGKGIRAGSDDYDDTGKISDSYISGGTLSITTTGSESNDVSCKGIKIGWATKSGNRVTAYAGNLNISGGSVIVNSSKSEGIEAKGNIVISGSAQVYVTSSGDDAINSQAEFDVTGGYVYAYSSANDAMDANHDMKISGGYVFAITTKGSPEVALDANTEESYKLYITGGTVVAYGGLESGYSSSNTVYSMSCTAGSWNALHNGSSYIAAFKAPSGISSVAVCAPSLSKGYTGVSVGSTTYANGTWATSSISGGTAVSLSTYSGNGGTPGGGGGWNPGGGGGRH